MLVLSLLHDTFWDTRPTGATDGTVCGSVIVVVDFIFFSYNIHTHTQLHKGEPATQKLDRNSDTTATLR